MNILKMEKVIQTQSLPDFNEQSKQEHIENSAQIHDIKYDEKQLQMKILKPCNKDTNQNLLH